MIMCQNPPGSVLLT